MDQKIIKSPEYKVDTEIQNILVQGKMCIRDSGRGYGDKTDDRPDQRDAV